MDPDLDPYRDTGKTCLGGGIMHCPSASSLYIFLNREHSEHCNIIVIVTEPYTLTLERQLCAAQTIVRAVCLVTAEPFVRCGAQ